MGMFSLPFLTQLTDLLGTTPIDDSIDTLSCLITAFLFLFSAILISAKTYVGSPIECWVPQTYSGEWGEFSENYCFLKDTYWYPSTEMMADIPEDHKERHRLSYYQWSSMYLTIGALAFMLPKFLWKMAQTATDMPLIYFCDTTNAIRTQSTDERAGKIREMGKFMRNKITASHAPHSMSSVSMSVVYGVVKVLYVCIAFVQFIMLGVFIGQKHDLFWGWNLFLNLMSGVTWETTGLFPRVTFCDFRIRELAGNNRDETIQCLIGLNEFNEKIFMFLWFWLVILFFSTVIGTVYTLMRNKKINFVSNLLHTIRTPGDKVQKAMFKEFGDSFLTTDGKLILSFVKSQSDLVAQELALSMYDDFQAEREVKSKLNNQLYNLVPSSKMLEAALNEDLHIV